jgi:protein-disulfide isomerase
MAKQKGLGNFLAENKVNIIGWVVVLALLGGFFVAANLLNQKKEEVKVNVLAIDATDNVRSNKDAKNTLIVYSDFQCPYCAAAHPMLQDLLKDYKTEVKLVFRHMPLESAHPNAFAAAMAAEAAGVQGKFWEMHDALFEKQSQWGSKEDPTDRFVSYAKDLKLDLTKFQADLKSAELEKRITDDANAGRSLGVSGTPTFYLNGVELDLNEIANDPKNIAAKFVK